LIGLTVENIGWHGFTALHGGGEFPTRVIEVDSSEREEKMAAMRDSACLHI
jgi:hypothetical protein